MNLIVAVDKNWNIGYKGKLLERISADMKYFKSKTINNTVVMGRVTFESLPKQKPLVDRKNIVLSRNKNLKIEGVTVVNSINELLEELDNDSFGEVFIIGGDKIYSILYPYCKKAYITKIHNEYEADASMENLDKLDNWQIVSRDEIMENKNGTKFEFLEYRNSTPSRF
jgi:dihydrofolate reductase